MSEMRGMNPEREGDGYAYPSEQWWLPGFSPLQWPGGWPLDARERYRVLQGERLLMRELSRQVSSASVKDGRRFAALAGALAEAEARVCGY